MKKEYTEPKAMIHKLRCGRMMVGSDPQEMRSVNSASRRVQFNSPTEHVDEWAD